MVVLCKGLLCGINSSSTKMMLFLETCAVLKRMPSYKPVAHCACVNAYATCLHEEIRKCRMQA